jgi:vacuolar-type H+-ATPase subunit H
MNTCNFGYDVKFLIDIYILQTAFFFNIILSEGRSMINVINQIIEIDKLAQQRIADAHDQKTNIIKELEQQKKELHDEYEKTAKEKLQHVNEVEHAFAQEKIDVIVNSKQQTIDSLENNYDQNHLKWEQELYNKVLGI